jgi:hypothetical protein
MGMATKQQRPEPTVKVVFDFPETISGVEVDHVIMRRPKVCDRVAASKVSSNEGEQTVHLIANLCEILYEDLLEFDDVNFTKLEAQYVAFRVAKS